MLPNASSSHSHWLTDCLSRTATLLGSCMYSWGSTMRPTAGVTSCMHNTSLLCSISSTFPSSHSSTAAPRSVSQTAWMGCRYICWWKAAHVQSQACANAKDALLKLRRGLSQRDGRCLLILVCSQMLESLSSLTDLLTDWLTDSLPFADTPLCSYCIIVDCISNPLDLRSSAVQWPARHDSPLSIEYDVNAWRRSTHSLSCSDAEAQMDDCLLYFQVGACIVLFCPF